MGPFDPCCPQTWGTCQVLEHSASASNTHCSSPGDCPHLSIHSTSPYIASLKKHERMSACLCGLPPSCSLACPCHLAPAAPVSPAPAACNAPALAYLAPDPAASASSSLRWCCSRRSFPAATASPHLSSLSSTAAANDLAARACKHKCALSAQQACRNCSAYGQDTDQVGGEVRREGQAQRTQDSHCC